MVESSQYLLDVQLFEVLDLKFELNSLLMISSVTCCLLKEWMSKHGRYFNVGVGFDKQIYSAANTIHRHTNF